MNFWKFYGMHWDLNSALLWQCFLLISVCKKVIACDSMHGRRCSTFPSHSRMLPEKSTENKIESMKKKKMKLEHTIEL